MNIFLILENKNYVYESFVSSMLLSCCTVEQEQSFYQAKTLAVFQNEDKSGLKYVAFTEKEETQCYFSFF